MPVRVLTASFRNYTKSYDLQAIGRECYFVGREKYG